MSRAVLMLGDARKRLAELPRESVQCVVTSPPYWGLRDYGVDDQIGLESSIQLFLDELMIVFDEIQRVLRGDGTLWVNMGDSYNSSLSRGAFGNQADNGAGKHGLKRPTIHKLHSKNLIGQPWRLAFRLQDTGWILRSEIIWYKTNPMPSSIEDRPTPAHETLFLFSKSPTYFYDQIAIREPAINAGTKRVYGANEKHTDNNAGAIEIGDTRNKWTVWPIPTEPCPEAHFATFPTKLVEPCILAGTSERGCCANCGAPIRRTLEVDEVKTDSGNRKRADAPGAELSESSALRTGQWKTYKTAGWEKSCKCETEEAKPCLVLDPFNGSGTTGLVALRHQRNYIGIELNPEYLDLAYNRIKNDAPLFNEVERVIE